MPAADDDLPDRRDRLGQHGDGLDLHHRAADQRQHPLNIAKSTAPDLTAAWYLPQPWGHIDLSGVLRPGIDVTDGRFFDHQFIGYGGHIGIDIKPGWLGWVKDDIIVALHRRRHDRPVPQQQHQLRPGDQLRRRVDLGGDRHLRWFNGPATAANAAR